MKYLGALLDETMSFIFFAITCGEHTENALPLLNLLDVLMAHNVHRFQIIFNMLLMFTATVPGVHRNKTFL